MTTSAPPPVPGVLMSNALVGALAHCYWGPARPGDDAVTAYYVALGVPAEVGAGAPAREQRVAALLWWVKNDHPERTAAVLGLMIADLHHGGHLSPAPGPVYVGPERERWLRTELAAVGLALSAAGELLPAH